MRSRRFTFFLLVVVIGIAFGLYYGWSILPHQRQEATFSQLRSDYRTDLILMVAEVYAIEKDSDRASARLSIFQNHEPLRLVQEAILTAGQLGYAANDLDLLANLAGGLQTEEETPQ
ncbi:MAG: hypothetical protein AB9891_08150 [Anaerolineaceae bacterium]